MILCLASVLSPLTKLSGTGGNDDDDVVVVFVFVVDEDDDDDDDDDDDSDLNINLFEDNNDLLLFLHTNKDNELISLLDIYNIKILNIRC